MKKSLATFIILSTLALSGCALSVSPVQPPHADFYGHPSLVVIPGTYVYAMTEVADDIFFNVGWWWRLWDGRWYTSRYYDRGWSAYTGVPGFYREIHPGWREFYRQRRWNGHPWACERIPAPSVQRDWKLWQNNRYWEKEKNWGVRGFRPTSYRQSGLDEPVRDGSRLRQPAQHAPTRFENRRRETVQAPDHRQEFPPERGYSRSAQPLFANRPTGDSDSKIRGQNQDRSPRDPRHTQPSLDRRQVNEEAAKARSDRKNRERQEYRQDRPLSDQGRQKSGDVSRQGREQDRGRSSQFGQRQRETSPERPQRRDESASRSPLVESRQKEGGQATPQRRERQHDEAPRQRTPQELPWQEPGQPGSIRTR
jgi:hypothetical protein